MGNRISLHEFDLDNKRFTQRGNPSDCTKQFNQKLMYEEPLWGGVRSSPVSRQEYPLPLHPTEDNGILALSK